jgi:DnaJ-class molecular chaperone
MKEISNTCSLCLGSWRSKCSRCGGEGRQFIGNNTWDPSKRAYTTQICPSCSGKGRQLCSHCGGSGKK